MNEYQYSTNRPTSTSCSIFISSSICCAFDDPRAIAEYKQFLITRFCCDSVSSATVAGVFQKLPILRGA